MTPNIELIVLLQEVRYSWRKVFLSWWIYQKYSALPLQGHSLSEIISGMILYPVRNSLYNKMFKLELDLFYLIAGDTF